MPEGAVPQKWRRAVVAILKDGYSSRIEVTRRALLDFQSMFPGAFTYELCSAFVAALKRPEIVGRRVYGMRPKGETYAFIFSHDGKQVYGKVCLTEDGRVVVIFSAHAPLKGEEA